jgi:hypothetical protein
MRNYDVKVYYYTDKDTGVHVVKATTAYNGKTVSTIAKCDPEDTFDFELGMKIALMRLDRKIARKRAAYLKDYIDFCQKNLAIIEREKCRIEKAIQRAEVAYIDHVTEAKQHETALAELLNTVN